MNARHRIACCLLALTLGTCRQTVVFDRDGDGGPGNPANFCLDGKRVTVRVTPRTPEIIVALDRSASMSAPFGATSISEVEAALVALGAAAERYQTLVQFGFLEFPGTRFGCTDTQGCCSGEVGGFFSDPVSFMSESRRCDYARPGCVNNSFERPTTVALDTCRDEYADRGFTNHSRYVLLVTDGEPTTCSGGNNGCPAATTASNLRAADIKTLVVVLGDVAEHDCLRNIALTGDADTGRDPFYYSATSPDTLRDTILNIIGSAARDACQLEVRDPIYNPDQVGLFWSNVALARGPQGWDIDKDRSWITLRGAACEDFLEGPAGELDVYECQAPR